MKLAEILKAGYTILYFDKHRIKSSRLIENYGVVELQLDNGAYRAIALDIDHKSIPIECALIVEFDEDIADSLLLAGVAPVSHDSVVRDFNETVEKREHYQTIRNHQKHMEDAWGVNNAIYESKLADVFSAGALPSKRMFRPEDLTMPSSSVSTDAMDALNLAMQKISIKKED